ncbi:MAG: protein-disulfide reductase DsbD family protein [Elusimicrobiota bacterium]
MNYKNKILVNSLIKLSLMISAVFIPSLSFPQNKLHTTVTLISESEHIQPGQPFYVGLLLKMDPHWHIYWKNPGDSGAPTKVTWNLPRGITAGELEWPAPKKIVLADIVTYGYEEEVLLLVKMTPATNISNSMRLEAKVSWLECKEECIPGSGKTEMTLPVKNAPSMSVEKNIEKFNQARFKMPLNQSSWNVTVSENKNVFIFTGKTNEQEISETGPIVFFPHDSDLISYSSEQKFSKQKDGFRLEAQKSESLKQIPEKIEGVLSSEQGWRGKNSEKALLINIPISILDSNETKPSREMSTLLSALLFGLIGGLLLNLMPCVLPVLSIKLLGLVKQTQGDKKEIWTHSLLFTLGVLISLWSLVGLLLILKSGGAQLGWGFQLQSPTFVFVLIGLFFLMALNFFGIFEIGSSLTQVGDLTRKTNGHFGAFLTGVLATVVATPCTAPFMGTALGFALSQPAIITFLIFTALGIGLSAPYILIAAQPSFLKYLPKPGAWMETFKNIMGFLLFATVTWLFWVLSLQTTSEALAWVFLGLFLLSLSTWIYGKYTLPHKSPTTRWIAIILALGLGALGFFTGFHKIQDKPSSSTEKTLNDWEPYSEERVEALRKEGRKVFVDFTAGWCLTCQVNEKTVLSKTKVQEVFKSENVALLKADWTLRDEKITQALAKFGRSGVPLYVYYSPTSSEGTVLSAVLTSDLVLETIKN